MTDEIARRAVLYPERYINDRFLPDKAIDLLDEACSCANLRNKVLAQYDEYNRQIGVYQKVIEREEQKEQDIDYESWQKIRQRFYSFRDRRIACGKKRWAKR